MLIYFLVYYSYLGNSLIQLPRRYYYFYLSNVSKDLLYLLRILKDILTHAIKHFFLAVV